MKKRKEAQAATDFHYENFLRSSRYTSVVFVLLAAFCVITVLNINTGNVDISVPEDFKDYFSSGRKQDGIYYLENPSSANSDGGHPGGSTFPFRIFITDIL